jgi:hypothetical protein
LKRTLLIGWLLIAVASAQALEGNDARYVSGTATTIRPDAIGRVDLGLEQSLIFESSQGKLVIPYAAIRSFEYRPEVTHHLGVLPAIAVGLLKARQQRHLFRISYTDDHGANQSVILEVPKHMAVPLQMILTSRVPKTCRASFCFPRN